MSNCFHTVDLDTRRHRHTQLFISLILISAVLLVYWQVTGFDFVAIDDADYIIQNSNVQSGPTVKGLIWAFTTFHASNWHPITWLSHMLDCEFYGLNPMGHHWTNVLLHILNTLLLFFIFNQMTKALWRSAFVAALFALHPLHVESVVWVAERKDVLSTFFGLLALFSYFRFVKQPHYFTYLAIIFFFGLGLMAKPMLVTFPFVLLLLDFWPLKRFQYRENSVLQTRGPASYKAGSNISLFREKYPLFFLAAISSVFTFFAQQSEGAVASLKLFPLTARISNALVTYVHYVIKAIWPWKLSVYYPHPDYSLLSWQVSGAALLIALSIILAVRYLKQYPYIAVGLFWYIGTLVPVIGLVQVGSQAMADRYTYIPLIGLFIVLAWGIFDISGRWYYRKTILSILAGIVLLALTICTWFQVRCWQNSETLFSHAVKATHNNWFAHKGLGLVYKKDGKFDKAVFHFNESLKICPDDVDIHVSLGNIFSLEGKTESAVQHYNTTLRIDPENTGAHNALGNVWARQGKAKEAIDHYHEALRINPGYVEAHLNLGKVFVNLREIQKAINSYRKALGLEPSNTIALYNLSWLLATDANKEFRNGAAAVKLAEKLCKLTGYNQPLALDALAAAYAEANRFKDAVLTVQKGLNLALQHGPAVLAAGMKKRLELYRAGHPAIQELGPRYEQ